MVKGDQRGVYRADGKDLLVFDEIINSRMVRLMSSGSILPLTCKIVWQ